MNATKLGKGLAIGMAVLTLVGVEARGQWSSWSPGDGDRTYFSGGGSSGSAWTPGGGDRTYYNYGGQSGSAWTPAGGDRTYYSGDLFRGVEGGSVLFESKDFSSRFSESIWVGAVERRNVKAMTGVAWNLKALETILGKQDKKTTSDAMFKAAAQVAVEQRNATALTEIVALCPACKTYQDEMKAAGQSRGAASPVTMPQIVCFPDFGMFDPTKKEDAYGKRVEELAQKLQPWETPALTPDLVRFSFRGMSTPEAENVATMANRGRETGNPAMLAQSAIALAGKNPPAACPYLKPERMLDEAAGLAVVLGDKKGLAQIIDIYENDVFGLKDADKGKAMAEELKMMGSSRGGAEGDQGAVLRLMKPSYVLIYDPGVPVVPTGTK